MEPSDAPPIATLKMKQQLTKAAFTDKQAEALVEMLRQWSAHMVTKEDLHQEMQALRWQMLLANAAIMATLLALFAFVA